MPVGNIVNAEIQNIKDNQRALSNKEDEYIFSLVCNKFFYNEGEFSFAEHYRNSFTDGSNDGGIDMVIINEDSSGIESLVLIQSKMVENIANSQDIIDMLHKIHLTVKNFKNNKTAEYNNNLKRIYKTKYDQLADNPPNIEIAIFINCNITSNLKERIQTKITNAAFTESYQINIYYKEDIEVRINEVNTPIAYVQEGRIEYDIESGKLQYGDRDEDGDPTAVLVNIKALSLRDLYDQYKDNGLFEQNFRYFTKNNKIDSNITASLQSSREKFWYKNNGIIIGCKDFSFDGDTIKLYDFSIINGCQTTTLIGNYKGRGQSENFLIPCKIIKPLDNMTDDEKDTFIANIAEASNSQKPINDRDLKSNHPEQKLLQKNLKENDKPVYLEIKRGEKEKLCPSGTYRNLDGPGTPIVKWQYLKNDEYGQKILSFQIQNPGTARTSKSKIWTNQIYPKIFRTNYNIDTTVDMLELFAHFKAYREDYIKNELYTDSNEEEIALNGLLHIPSIIGFLIKVKKGLVDIQLVNNEQWASEVSKQHIDEKLFIDELPDEYNLVLHDFFQDIISELALLYGSSDATSCSNFMKKDETYVNVMLKKFVSLWNNNTRRRIYEEYLSIFK